MVTLAVGPFAMLSSLAPTAIKLGQNMSTTRMQALQNVGTALADASSASTAQMSFTASWPGAAGTKGTRPQVVSTSSRADVVAARPFTSNVLEGDKAHYVNVEAPGLAAGDLAVSVENDRVVVRSDSRDWSTAFSIPDGVERDQISAKFDDGVLRVTMPKTSDTARRDIPIKTGNG